MTSSHQNNRPLVLGIEGGGTRTVAILADGQGKLVKRMETGPANLRLLSERELVGVFRTIGLNFPRPDALGIGLAGARTGSDLLRIRMAAAKVWPQALCHAMDDLETGLAAAKEIGGKKPMARVLVLSGTGSCCYGRNVKGKTAKVGGWGHILGDAASGYDIGLKALRDVLASYDQDGNWPTLGMRILHRLQLNEPNDIIAWAKGSDKSQIASLAIEVFEASERGDKIARAILKTAATRLAQDALACAHRLAPPGKAIQFVLAGSVLLKQPGFARGVARLLRKGWPGAEVAPLTQESAWGAVKLAQKTWGKTPVAGHTASNFEISNRKLVDSTRGMPVLQSGKISPTEQRNPRSLKLDQLSIPRAVELMLSEDAKIPAAILRERQKIAQAVNLIAKAFKMSGRLFYAGAGTSGRLGVLDASECPPTFRTAPEMTQGIIAGGQSALWRSVEGAEDDLAAGARAISFRQVSRKDVVVGIAASGRTPFVWGALGEAKRRGAKTILLGFNPYLKISPMARPTLVITPNLGPEILTGSTRLKSGTATKLILNIFTTLAMVRIGKVVSNLMVDMNPSNVKLRDRAVRIVQELNKVDYLTAEDALRRTDWVIKLACARLKGSRQVSSQRAKRGHRSR